MKYLYLLFLLAVYSCSQALSEKEKLEQYFGIIGVENPKKVLIIHLDGCSGCFSYHQILMKKVNEVGNYDVVLVTKSKKKARLLFEEDFNQNTYFDTNLEALDFGLITGFPTIYIFDENGDLSEKSEIDYGTSNLILP
ncbi:thioredoxin domain-containing protein [Algoriphagus marinus]|uniref:hypothetical protein n=1 Tax=Algoriphagus marinus TaxID=1925762 RepID=UPI00094B8EEE|nr:hypothetical protein [Algoriphagus marinus]